MNYSVKAKEAHDFVSANPGMLAKDLPYDRKLIWRLVGAGVLRAYSTPIRGAPQRIYAGTAPPQLPLKQQQVKKPKHRPTQDAIVEYLRGRGEATIGQIADHLGKPTNNISGTLLVMASAGRVVRRRVLGKISGRAQSCEWYSYRLS